MKTVFSDCHSSAFKSQITIIKITIIKIKLLVLKIDLKMAVCGLRFFRFFILSPPPSVSVSVCTQRGQKTVSNLELQAFVNHLLWVLTTKLESSERAAYALDC